MTWLIIPLRLLLAGSARYLDGSDLTYPRILTNALLGLLAGWTAWDATNNLIASAIVCVNAGLCITLGQTNWTSWKWQALRGAAFGFGGAYLLTKFAGVQHGYGLDLYVLCYVVGYVCYFFVDKIKLPTDKFHWEHVCRIIQSTCICIAASLL